uniref:AB hydrolase-1 domain-containing protein n=1 Tax=Amphimedon queenslandica TaxID=400682 RepID=A0A1X7VFG4_AMPQE
MMEEQLREVKVSVNGVELHCNIKGNGPNPLLCIPGATAPSHWVFSLQLEYFGRSGSEYTVIAFDPRGYGRSKLAPRTYSMTPEHHTKIDARDAHQVMKSLGYEEYFVLGWCGGGLSAIYLAALFPDAVKGLVVWGSRVRYTEYEVKITEAGRDLMTWNPEHRQAFEDVYGCRSAYQAVWDQLIDSIHATYEHLKDKNGELCTEEMKQVSCPTLVLHGARDKMATLSQAQLINESIPNSKLIVFDQGTHFIHKTSEDFNHTVDSFFKKFI